MYDLMEHLKGKKQEYMQMKGENELEREEIRKQEKMAQSFKFTKMSKKTPFFPTLDTRGLIQTEYVTSNDNALAYLDGRQREALMFPNRVKDHSNQMTQIKLCDGQYFSKTVGQEFDKYDTVM
jgi:hypothetical protein